MSISAASAYASTFALKLTGSVSTGSVADKGASSPANGPAKAPATDPSGGGNASVIVSLSVEARTVMTGAAGTATAKASASRFAAYFPTRDGKPVTALANAVDDPGALSSSAGLSLPEAAKDARARMDAQYKAMDASGKPFDPNAFEGRDWNTVLGDLDRRSLYAISSNADGLFSKEEQTTARDMMLQQQSLAMGLYTGPTSQQGSFVDPYNGDTAAQMKAGIQFLDKVSDEEKSSLNWAVDRASVQVSYEIMAGRDGKEPEKFDGESPLLKLIKSAMDTMRNDPSRSVTHGQLGTAKDLKAQPWFKGFESQLDAAIEQTKDMYLSKKAPETA